MHFIAKHGKTYTTRAEYALRFITFAETYANVQAHNAQEDMTHTAGINYMADWTEEEYRQLLGYKNLNEEYHTYNF